MVEERVPQSSEQERFPAWWKEGFLSSVDRNGSRWKVLQYI